MSYDSRLVVGILGGASGTTYDAFHQLWEAKKYGARVALYGRMINNAEHQLTFIEHLRALADDHLLPAEAVRSYHAALAKFGIPTVSLPGGRHSAERAGIGLQRRGHVRAWGKAAAGRPSRRRARLLQDDPGREDRLEPRSLEADSRLRGLSRSSSQRQWDCPHGHPRKPLCDTRQPRQRQRDRTTCEWDGMARPSERLDRDSCQAKELRIPVARRTESHNRGRGGRESIRWLA